MFCIKNRKPATKKAVAKKFATTRKTFAKLKIEEQKSGSYKNEPKYKNYRISKKDIKIIEEIKSGKYKKEELMLFDRSVNTPYTK